MTNNLVELLISTAKRYPAKKALMQKVGAAYQGITYQELKEKVEALSAALKKLGIQKGDKIALLSKNRPEWVIADQAIMASGAVSVPLYDTLTAEQIKYIIDDCQAKLLIFSYAEQVTKVKTLRDQLPSVKNYISMDELSEKLSNVLTLPHLIKEHQGATKLEELVKNITRQDISSIIYTSGTTGDPKGVILTHGNFLTNAEDILALNIIDDGKETVFSFLPLSHVLERTAGYYTMLARGATIYYAVDMQNIAQDIQKVSPTIVIAIPRLFEKVRLKIMQDLHGVKRFIFGLALFTGKRYTALRSRRKKALFSKFFFKVFDKIVYSKIKEKFGGRIKFFVSGGAHLTREIGRFFEALDITIIEGYGLTESSPVIAVNTPKENKIGTVGRALKRVEVKLAPDGELLAKGPSIMPGYFNLPKETAEALDKDGWLHTGDIARIDEEGFISIIDRKKEIIVMSNGKNVAPLEIENTISKSRYIAQCIVIGDGKNYISALIVPRFEIVENYTKKNNISFKDRKELIKDPRINELITKAIAGRSEKFAPYQQIKKFILLPAEFTLEKGELTPTMKFKRKVIYDKFKKEIAEMYKE